MKYKLDFSETFKNLNGTDVEDASGKIFLGRRLAETIVNTRDETNMALKLSGIAHELYQKGMLIVDQSDMSLLQKWIEDRKELGIEFKAQLLYVFHNKQEDSELKL